jgi:hypothetical protein
MGVGALVIDTGLSLFLGFSSWTLSSGSEMTSCVETLEVGVAAFFFTMWLPLGLRVM